MECVLHLADGWNKTSKIPLLFHGYYMCEHKPTS